MSIPATAATDNSGNSDQNVVQQNVLTDTLTFQEQVIKAVDTMIEGEDGKMSFPEGLDETVMTAANTERRRRDTQSALAKEKNEAATLRAQNEELVKLVKQGKQVHITPEDQAELDELKFTDADEWRKRMNDLERLSANEINTTLSDISDKAKAAGSLGERQVLLEAYLDDNPGLVINDEVLARDIPPRITKALEDGEVSFMQFLGNVKEYLTAGKVIQDNAAGNDPNLTNVGGGPTPSEAAQDKDEETSYEDSIF